MRFRSAPAFLLLILLAPARHPRAALEFVPGDPEDAQERWFLRQRAFPGTEIPPNARREAFEGMRNRWPMQSDAAGSSYVWRSLGPAPIQTRPEPGVANTGRVTAIAISPTDPQLVIVGSSSGGIWRTTDGGATFKPVSDDQIDLTVGAIAFAPSNPNVVYAGMGDDHMGTGVLKSTDGGATWRLITDSSFAARSMTRRILVDPTNENIVWLAQNRIINSAGATASSGRLLKSVDGGVSWSSPFNGIVLDALFPSNDGSTLLIATVRAATFGTGGIYRTTDGGASWARVYSGPENQDSPPMYRLAEGSPGRVFLAAVEDVDDVSRYTLQSSADGGVHWSEIAKLPTDYRLLYLGASPHDDHMLFLGGIGSYRSSDRGGTWTKVPIHVDQHAIAFDRTNASRVWLGNDGGLFRSTDGGLTFQSLGDRLPIVQFYSVNAHPTSSTILLGGSQDNGLQRRNGNGQEWTELLGGDFGTQLFDRDDPSRILTNSIFANLVRFKDDGNSTAEGIANQATFGESAGNARIAFIAPLAEGPDGTVWFGTWRLFASKDFGTTWTAPAGTTDLTAGSPDGNDDVLSAIGIAGSDARTLYTGSAAGRVMVTHDGAVTWTDRTPPVQRFITSIAVSRTSPDTAYVSVSGYRSAHIFKTTTSGSGWTAVSEGLPDMPANVVYIDRQQPDTLYAGTDVGVFRSDTAGDRWYPYNSGMPPVIVTSFTTTADGRLIAGTYGRGAYELVSGEPASPRRRAARH